MCVTLIGGMDRLQSEYISVALSEGHEMKCIPRDTKNFQDKIGKPDRLIIFTNKISHEAKNKALRLAKRLNIPVALLHSCGISSLRDCLRQRL